jgi:GT2 family glycosyltransferase
LDCIEKLVRALDQNPECGVAHCCLDFIDEKGGKVSGEHRWDNWFTTRFFGDWNRKYHVRPRGHDTVVALGLRSVYYSVTQILIRRSLFDEVGLFERKWGSFGDLEWQMRAALATKTVHVPEYLATWRIHVQQASQAEHHFKAVRAGWFLEMANSVIQFSRAKNLPFQGGLPGRLRFFYGEECISARLAVEIKYFRKFRVLMAAFRFDPGLLVPFFKSRFRTRILGRKVDREAEVRKELSHAGLDSLLTAK